MKLGESKKNNVLHGVRDILRDYKFEENHRLNFFDDPLLDMWASMWLSLRNKVKMYEIR